MALRWSAVFIGLSALGAMLPLSAEEEAREPVRVTTTQRVDFAPGGTVRVDAFSGYLDVEGWDQPAIEITVTKSTQQYYESPKREQMARQLEQIQVIPERRSGDELVISSNVRTNSLFKRPFPGKGGFTVECRIRAPRGSRLVIQHGHGFVLVMDMTGDVEANSTSGDIVLLLPEQGGYSIDAKSKIGNILSDFTGAVRHRLAGEQLVRDAPPPSRRIYLRMRLGGITIKEVPPKPEAPLAASAR